MLDHNMSADFIEGLIPFELDIYVSLLLEKMKKKAEAAANR